ncbi:MAG TPA: hypothetical protein VI172_04865 [Candidatus Dormibacteraeota bacterium]
MTLDLDVAARRTEHTWQWMRREPGNFVPLSARTHFEHDMPALLAELKQARAQIRQAEAQLQAHREFAARIDVYAVHDELNPKNVEALQERLTEACDLATELHGEGQ